MVNKQGLAEQYKEVIHEDTLKIDGSSKAPDYCFRIGPERKFFVEAKKPSVNLKDNTHPAFQLRRYAWSANLPLSILTDFDELAIYDCRVKPNKKDKASTARILYFKYNEYISRWDEIRSIFSKDAVLQGSFDRYAQDKKNKRGTTEVNSEFLKELEKWRELFAKNIALRNNTLSHLELNYAVQRTIDRILFLRIAEDQGIEDSYRLQNLTKSKGIYPSLCDRFLEANDKYNSGLFHFRQERGRPEPPDELSLKLQIDDKPIKQMIDNLYYPNSPYEFLVIPVEILGQVYEQFLGKTIHLVNSRVIIEEKPIIKKSGGVYYTPSYIVNEIVRETLAPLIEGKRPLDVKKLKIIDPACGSGSFLLGAYNFLLKWHLSWYLKDGVQKHLKKIYINAQNEWKLSSSEKKEILLNNIYGVDIDAQAVETTKLSLLLRVLKDENKETISQQFSLFKERALPDLGANIKCGNSLVDTEFYNHYQYNMFGDEEIFKINTFEWKKEFPKIFTGKNGGGFDIVIGNPPYVRIQILQEIQTQQADFFSKKYKSAQKGNYDVYVTFVERGLEILNSKGKLGFILPHKFLNANYGEPLRDLLSKGNHVSKIVHFGDQQVFDQATTYTCLLYLQNKSVKKIDFEKVINLNEWRINRTSKKGQMDAKQLGSSSWQLVNQEEKYLLESLSNYKRTLETETYRIFQGFKTGADKIFIVEELERKQGKIKIKCSEDEQTYWIESDLLSPLVKGGDSRNFIIKNSVRRILFPYSPQSRNKLALISKDKIDKKYPLAWKYLNKHKKILEARERGRWKGPQWYGFSRNQALNVMFLPKIFTPDIAPHSSFSIDESAEISFTGGAAGGYGILLKDTTKLYLFLGILNSKLIDWFIKQTATQMRGGYYSFESKYIKHIPIELPKNGKANKLESLVGSIVQISKKMEETRISNERNLLLRNYETIKSQIDRLVYEIYGLNSDQISLIEVDLSKKQIVA